MCNAVALDHLELRPKRVAALERERATSGAADERLTGAGEEIVARGSRETRVAYVAHADYCPTRSPTHLEVGLTQHYVRHAAICLCVFCG